MLRRRLGERRIGHAGTLDPSATGVLVVGVGMVTRLLRFVGDGRKRYTGEVVLGVETDSLDADGAVMATHDIRGVDARRRPRVVAEHLLGDIEQVPPMVSAIRSTAGGCTSSAREGIEVERAPRPVTVDRFDIVVADRRPRSCWRSRSTARRRHVRPLAGRRPRSPARRRRAPAQPAAHRRRAVHDRRGRAARRVRAAAADRGRAGDGHGGRRRATSAALIAARRVLPAARRRGRGRWSRATAGSRSTSRSATARPSRPSSSPTTDPGRFVLA